MKKNLLSCFTVYLVFSLLIPSEAKSQEPAAPNGKVVTVKGLKIYYEETGRGMPLLLLHGFGRSASDWRPFTPALSKNFRTIAIDLPGHGRSDYMDTSDVFLHKRAAEYILGLLDALHIDSAHIMGVSSGGFITLHIATMRPQLAKKIIVVGGQVYYSNTTRKVITELGEPAKNPVVRLDSLVKTHGKEKGILVARQFWNFRKLYGDPSFTPDVLSTIKANAFIIHGDNDPIAPVSNAWEMYQNIPNAHLWIVPNGEHVPFLIPGNQEIFFRRVLEFLLGNWERK